MKSLPAILTISAPILLAGIWLGVLQYKADATEADFSEHKKEHLEMNKDLRQFMIQTREDLAFIKARMRK